MERSGRAHAVSSSAVLHILIAAVGRILVAMAMEYNSSAFGVIFEFFENI